MANIHQTSATATAYARSLLELANEQQQAEPIGQELAGVREIVDQNPGFRDYLADPGIGHAERTAAMDRIFRGRISPLLFNFLGVLNQNGRIRKLDEIENAYADLLEDQLGNVEVDVTTAHRLEPGEVENVRQRISTALGKNAVVHPYVDDAIIGGLVIRVQDRLIDASVRYQLQAIKRQLMAATPK